MFKCNVPQDTFIRLSSIRPSWQWSRLRLGSCRWRRRRSSIACVCDRDLWLPLPLRQNQLLHRHAEFPHHSTKILMWDVDVDWRSRRHLRSGDVDWLLLCVMIVSLIGLTLARTMLWLYQTDLYYHSNLRGIYEWTKDWM